MWSSKKRIKAFTSAVMLSLALYNAMPFSISAAESTEATTTTVTEPVTTEITTSMTTTTDLSEDIIHDYYDTKGNATLIKHEDIIYNSEEMQFIAVTTKDGDVFYILINYSADGDEDNVYFLNKVDDFDLYSLLYAEDENNKDLENINPAEQAALYADAATNGHFDSPYKAEVTTDVPEPESPDESKIENNSMTNNNILIISGIAVLVIIAVIILLLKFGSKKKKKDDLSDFEEDDYPDYGEVEDENE